MGLDITAYRQLTPAPDAELDSYDSPVDYNSYWKPGKCAIDWTEENWPGRTAGLGDGDAVYSFEDSHGFRAGSYGGYSEWRRNLAKFAGYTDAAAVWNKSVAYGAFAELIDFADNEGIIGSVVAVKLAKDFSDNLERAKTYMPEDGGWFLQCYQNWLKAFEMAADNGAVDFH